MDSRDSVHDIRFAPRHMGLKLAACSSDGFVRIYEAVDINNLSLWSLMDEIEVQKLSYTSILSIPQNNSSSNTTGTSSSSASITATLNTTNMSVATSTNITPNANNSVNNTTSSNSVVADNSSNANFNSLNLSASLKGSSNSLTDREREALSAANIGNTSTTSNSSSNSNIAMTTSNTCSCICWNPSPLDPRPMIIIGTGNPVYTSYSTTSNVSVALTSASANVLSSTMNPSNPSSVSSSSVLPSTSPSDSNTNTSTARIYEYNEQTRKWINIESLSINSPILDLSWAPNVGRTYHLIATASKDKKVKIWKLQPQSQVQAISNKSTSQPSLGNTKMETKEVACFEDHHAEVWRTEWNITGTILASSGDDGTVRLYKSNLQNDWKCVSVIGGDDNV